MAAPERFAETSDSSCTAGAVHTWTLVGCTVAPGFEFAGFELAPPGWMPGA